MTSESVADNMNQQATVLVIDDDPNICVLLERWLNAAGYRTVTARTAEEGLRMAESESARIALCDVSLPDKDGLWLVRELRKRTPNIRIIFATAHDDLSPFDTLQPGVVGYVTKPFEQSLLLAWVRFAAAQ